MAKRKFTTGKIVITILVVAIILYLLYVWSQTNQAKTGEENQWHDFEWGGSNMGGKEVLLCCTDNIQSMLKLGDKVEYIISQ